MSAERRQLAHGFAGGVALGLLLALCLWLLLVA
jgi:hypothetical protein